MRVLVTGGAGYIGSVVTSDLVRSGHEVSVFDNLSRGHSEAVSGEAELIVGDLADVETVGRVLSERQFDAVMHFAALIEAGESMKAPELYFRGNTVNTFNLLEAALRNEVGKFVFSSTAAVYGEPLQTPIEENARLKPSNAYGESKLLVEQMLSWFHRVHGLHYASLRYFNAAGSSGELGEDHQPESHLIPLVLQVALGNRPHISVFGSDYPTPDGTCVRDYIHVSDLASAHLLVLEALSSREELVYNLGNGSGFSVREVIDAARAVTNREIRVVDAPRRAGDPAVLVAGSNRIKQELGWNPKFPDMDQIVESAWSWHRRFPHGYGNPS
jgi:UDP-glucose 4-epimerase